MGVIPRRNSRNGAVKRKIFLRDMEIYFEMIRANFMSSYQPADNMSVYDVDGPVQPRPEAQRDIGYNQVRPYASTDTFPEAHHVQPAPGTVRREPTSVLPYQTSTSRRDPPSPTSFPVARPVG